MKKNLVFVLVALAFAISLNTMVETTNFPPTEAARDIGTGYPAHEAFNERSSNEPKKEVHSDSKNNYWDYLPGLTKEDEYLFL